jgi:hypothetical protein
MQSTVIAHCSLDAINLRSHKFARRAASAFPRLNYSPRVLKTIIRRVYFAGAKSVGLTHRSISSCRRTTLASFGEKSELRTTCSRCSRGSPRRNRIYAIPPDAFAPTVAYFSIFSRAQWLNPFTGDSTRRSARCPYGVTQSPLHDAKCSTRVGR